MKHAPKGASQVPVNRQHKTPKAAKPRNLRVTAHGDLRIALVIHRAASFSIIEHKISSCAPSGGGAKLEGVTFSFSPDQPLGRGFL